MTIWMTRDSLKVELVPVTAREGEGFETRWQARCRVPDGVEVPGKVFVNRHVRTLVCNDDDPMVALCDLWDQLGGYEVLEKALMNNNGELTLKDLMHQDKFVFADNAVVDEKFKGVTMRCLVCGLHCWGKVLVEQGWANIVGYEKEAYRFPIDTPVVRV